MENCLAPNTNNFSAVGPFEAARSHVVVMPTGDGKAVVVGGRTATGNSTQQIMELYDPGTGSISTIQTELFSDDPDWVVSSDLRPTGVQKKWKTADTFGLPIKSLMQYSITVYWFLIQQQKLFLILKLYHLCPQVKLLLDFTGILSLTPNATESI